MRRILYIIPLVFLAVVSCREDTLDVYNGDDYVHFTPSVNGSPEVEYNFALDGNTTLETEVKVPVEIRLWGYIPESDFQCNVSVVADKTNALSSDYVRPEYAVFRKGYHVDTLWVNVKRRPELLATDYYLVLQMDGTSDDHIVGPGKYNTVTLHIYDKIKTPPAWWATTPALGDYTPMKYRVLNAFLGKVLRNLDGYTNITFKEKVREFKQWWKDNWESYRYYDADGTTPLYDTIPD